jgi:hypothetical protein
VPPAKHRAPLRQNPTRPVSQVGPARPATALGELLSQLSEAPLANVVDVNYSALSEVAKEYLPPIAAYDGMHRHLRDLATRL